MKSVSHLMAFLCLSALFSCRAEPVDYNDNTEAYLMMGQWKVRECAGNVPPGTDLAAYSLQFAGNGQFTARRNSELLEGSWRLNRASEGKALVLQLRETNNDLAPIGNTWTLRYSDPNEVQLARDGASVRLGRP